MLNKGVSLFWAQGYHGTGLQGILDVVNIPKDSFLGNLVGEIGNTSEAYQKSLQSAVKRYRDLLQSGLVKSQQQINPMTGILL